MADIIIKVLLIMGVLLSFAIPGYLLRKKDLVKSDSMYSFSNLLLCVCQPLLIIKAFAMSDVSCSKSVLLNFLYVLLFSFAALFATFFLTKLSLSYIKKEELQKKKNLLVCIGTFSNCSFVGIPFIEMFSGSSQAVMYLIIFSVAFNILLWTLGAYLITGDKSQISVKKALLNPCSMGSIVGFVFYLFPQINIFSMPAIAEVQQILVYTGNMTAPLSMLIVGVRLAELSPKALFCDKGVYVASAVRLVLSPLLTFLIILPFKLTGVFADDIYVLLAPAIAMAMPPAGSVVAFAEKYDGEKEYAAAAYATGTLLSLFTLPLILVLFTL